MDCQFGVREGRLNALLRSFDHLTFGFSGVLDVLPVLEGTLDAHTLLGVNPSLIRQAEFESEILDASHQLEGQVVGLSIALWRP